MASNPRADLERLVTADVGLPHSNPTIPYWMLPPSPLASTKSERLPSQTDVIVIGSGITAASVTRTLLLQHPTLTVSVLEARDLCSGATGRNGGQLVSYGGTVYSDHKKLFGKEIATEIVSFTFENIRKTKELIKEYPTSDIYPSTEVYRDVKRYLAYGSEALYKKAVDSVSEFEKDNPSLAGNYELVNGHVAAEVHGVHNVAGVCIFGAGVLSPYRLVTTIFGQLIRDYAPKRLSLETNTPVLSVSYDVGSDSKYPYAVETHRGTIRSSHVVYCTNAYAGNLLPKLRGPLYPFRGTMSVQELDHRLPNRGNTSSWGLHDEPKYDAQSGLCAIGTYYLQQNPLTKYFYFGGNEDTMAGTITPDDSVSPVNPVMNLEEQLRKLFGLSGETGGEVIKHWTGIMGFTADGYPLVGQLPPTITDRLGNGEWIAAGFNGMGMSLCVASGEMLANLLLGKSGGTKIPVAFQITQDRLKERLTVKSVVEKLSTLFPTSQISQVRS